MVLKYICLLSVYVCLLMVEFHNMCYHMEMYGNHNAQIPQYFRLSHDELFAE